MIKRLLLAAFFSAVATPAFAQISLPYSFTAGTTIVASEVNSNFSALANAALNKGGDTITGAITVSASVTIDGVDISAFLNGSGMVYANTAGTNLLPSFSRTLDTNTGLYFPAADEVAVTLGGTQRWLLNASGLTIFGVNLVNSSGKIPAISSTYFTSTAASATDLTSGTVPLARLVGITSTEILDGTLLNADVNAAAAIDWTKISKSGSSLADLATRSATDLTSGTLPDGRLSGTYSSSLTFAGVLTQSANYEINTSSTTATINGTGQSLSPGTASIIYVTSTAGTDTVTNIGNQTDGKILYICNAGTQNFKVATGGSVNTQLSATSSDITAKTCKAVIYRSSTASWWIFQG